MRNRFLRPLASGVLLAALAATGSGAPAPAAESCVLDLTAPRPTLEPVGDGGRVAPGIRGFGHTSRPGRPLLPLQVLLVAIPPGSRPELRILSADEETLGSLRVASVPRVHVEERLETPRAAARRETVPGQAGRGRGRADAADVQEYDLDDAPAPEDVSTTGSGAESAVRLGRIGYLRGQRTVEVLYTPVVYDGAAGRGTLYPHVRAEVVFHAPDGGSGRFFREDPAFEEIYRKSLVNYEQGKTFRAGAGETEAAPVARNAADLTAAPPDDSAGSPAPAPDGATAAGDALTALATSWRYKFLVNRSGVYRVDYAWLQANAPQTLTADPRTLGLSAEGVEVPIAVRNAAGASGEADGILGPGDYLEFYGRPKGGPPTLVNYDYPDPFPDIYQANDFTDTQVYWLSASGAPGSHARIPSTGGAPVNGFATAGDFQETAVWDENNLYLPLEGNDPYFSIPSLLAGSAQATRDISQPLPGLAPVATPVDVTVRLRGGSSLTASNPDHRTVVWINGDTAGGADYTWDGEVIQEKVFSEAQSLLTNPTTIHFSLPGISGVSLDKQYIDTVTFRYRRLFTAAADTLTFSYPNQDARFQVGGFSGPAPIIYEITRTLTGSLEADPVQITGATVAGSPSSTFTFEVPRDASPGAPPTRTFVVTGPAGLLLPDAVTPAADPVLHDPALSADIIVIAARSTVDATPGGALDNLLAYRASTQGLSSKVVFIDQIYDEFSFGLRDPNAMRSFLAYAYDNWKGPAGTAPPPTYVLLVGDGTGDYKNNLARADWVDQVPTQMMFASSSILGYYSSDNWIASFRGADELPDVLLGRISTRTAAESAAVFAKILSYEQSPPPGLWKGHAMLMTGDDKQVGDASLFESESNLLAATYLSAPPYTLPSPPLYFAESPWNSKDPAGYKTAVINELNAGSAVMNYIGHGSFESYGVNTFFTSTDAQALVNGPLLPFMVNVNCLSGGFHDINASGSLGEVMVNNPAGGSVATLAPSGLSVFFVMDVVTDQLYGTLFGKTRERGLGAATLVFRTALSAQGSLLDVQSYTFLGDPATRLATPAPAPPSGLAALAGNGQVSLSWLAAAQPVSGYHLYRATLPGGPYSRLSCDPVSATSCVDHAVTNATRYYYYAVSYDAEGFEGRWSNFNDDCDAGPGCVSARPVNPNPPVPPAGLSAADAQIGGALIVSWAANPESDIRSYSLYYGTQPGQHPTKVSLSLTPTSTVLGGLTDSVRYFMVLTATNTSGIESQPSAEVSGVSHLIQGIAPPRAITDLTITRQGADLVLRWSQPTVDIYGRPTIVTGYRVYASGIVNFVPGPSNLLVSLTGAASTTYTHAGAVNLTGNLYYLVTAVDINGYVSGAGRDLPNGIQTLSVSIVTANPFVVRLSWPAITTDIQGYESLIDHYQVHRTSVPVGRGSLNSSTILRDNLQATSVDLDLSGLAGPSFFSVIAVDDRGNLSPF